MRTQGQSQLKLVRFCLLLPCLALPLTLHAQFTYTAEDGVITITEYTGPGGAVIIPGTITDLPVTRIGESAFYNAFSLTSVMIPGSVTNIGDYVFYGCTNLTSITIPNGVTRIGNYQFRGCTSLSRITIPAGATSIGFGAFAYCASLTNVTIPDRVTTIGFQAFAYCTNLAGVYFQGSAPSLGSFVFDGDTLTTVYYRPGTTGWGPTLGGRPTLLWNPLMQTAAPNFGIHANRFGFTLTGTAGIPVVIEAATAPASAVWSALQSCTLTNGSIYFTDPTWTNYPTRVYRIRSP